MSINNSYSLKIGETAKVKSSFFKSSESIIYAGMINDQIYSMAVSWTFGYNSMAYNLYLPLNQKEFYTQKGKVLVEYANKDEIRFTYTSL